MQHRQLGRSGLKVSLSGLGCNQFGGRLDFEGTKRVVHKALDLGITLFDTADAYGNRGGSEELLGKALGARRKDIVLATKFALPMDDTETLRGGSRRYIMHAVEASLRRLGTEWIDLYQLHRPDPLTPIEETLRALDDLVTQGKVRYIGCSNLVAWQVVEAQWAARQNNFSRFISCQDEYSLLNRKIERDLVPAMQAYDVGLLPFFPLAGGFLTGKYRRGRPLPEGARITTTPRYQDMYFSDRNWEIVEKLAGFAEARGKTLLDVAFSWLAAQPIVGSVIAGATEPAQLEANIRAVEWKLSPAEIEEIGKISAPA